MPVDRRQFLLTSAAAVTTPTWARGRPISSAVGSGSEAEVGSASVRADFPRASAQTYLNSAGQHPLGLPVLRAMERHLHYQAYGPGDDRAYFSRQDQADLKSEFGSLINAEAEEIAFVQSTSDGENIVVAGMDLARRGGNVVVDDLHFTSSLFMYKKLESRGLELRVVKQRDGAVPLEAMDDAIDGSTRLVSMALVSNINGYMHDVAPIAALAHERGAYLYADIIQAAGAVPLDVRSMGIDFAACSTYKWLMAERGFGLLYVRRDLQDTVVPTTRWGHRQVRGFDRGALTWEERPGAARYETGNISEPLAAATLAGVRYVKALGLENVVRPAQRLIGRLRRELPAAGYPSMTPAGTGTPIVAFRVADPEETIRRLREQKVVATVVPHEKRMRISVSVFNDDSDLDRLTSALAG
jgi:selenocysteine lyase/cysteine desulfurase